MNVKRTKHAERSEATRAALVAAARPLFAERGFAGVGTEEIVARGRRDARRALPPVRGQARAVRGGLRAGRGRAHAADRPGGGGRGGRPIRSPSCASAPPPGSTPAPSPDVQRIVLLDGPVGARLGALARDRHALRDGARRGRARGGRWTPARSRPSPCEPLAHLLIGAIDEAALYVATADDQEAARAEVGAVLDRLLGSLA